MAVPFGQWSFGAGELAPSLWGHIDLAKFHIGAATMRNLFASYRGGAYSRAGTAFVGYSKQTGRAYPPRLVTFQFNINQGLALEFGHQYLRVIQDGAFVTEAPVDITGITQADPAVVAVGALRLTAATPVNGGVLISYAPGDMITVGGGTALTQGVLSVTDTLLLAATVLVPGAATGSVYAPGDTVTLAPVGGTATTAPIATIATTQVLGATIAAGGSGGGDGTQTVTGTTGTGARFQASVTVAGGAITAVLAITVAGAYTVNPTVPSAEPVTGAGLAGAQLDLAIGIFGVAVTAAGILTANGSGQFTQSATSGAGTGATFQGGLFAPHALGVSDAGVYTAVPANPASQAATTGAGRGAEFTVSATGTAPFADGDWVYLAGIGGMTALDGNTYVAHGATAGSIELYDVFGNPVDATAFPAYTGGGTAARLFTLATPWAEADLPWLKWTQSADVMSICCWNQQSGTAYQPCDLAREANNRWTPTPFAVKPYAGQSAQVAAQDPTSTGLTWYQYGVTAIDQATGQEGAPAYSNQSLGCDIATTLGSVFVGWDAVPGAASYNVYKAVPSYGAPIQGGTQFGYATTTAGQQWVDNNTVPDFSQTPPLFADPFSPGAVEYVNIAGAGAAVRNCTVSITSATGSGFVGSVLIDTVNQNVTGVIVVEPGTLYQESDTLVFACNAGAILPTGTIVTGPQTGTWPSLVHYFQERRGYAASPNQPDTYWFSAPGNFANFNVHDPVLDDDAITGTPWAVEVNGIQWIVPMPGGDVVLTGLSAWQLTGAGGSAINPQPITPASQQAQPQAYNGCSATVPPIKIDYDILYVQAKGSIIRDLAYNYWINIYTGEDITQFSSQLFTGYTIREWAWAEEPYKIAWAVRDDGILLSLTWLKPQQVSAWCRHDTQGLFQTVCSVTEPPVDAVYLGAERFIGPDGAAAYTIERMDNRIWAQAEDAWCVDCALALPQPAPAATLYPTAPLGRPSGVAGLAGGTGYAPATTARLADPTGAGAAVTLTIGAGGAVTAVAFAGGAGYTDPVLVLSDPSAQGRGFAAAVTLDNSATWTASAAVFAAPDVGSVIRAGGGRATITAVTGGTQVAVSVTQPVAGIVPGTARLAPVASGAWTMTAPVTTIGGLDHLAGQIVTGLADGEVIAPTPVAADGTVALAAPASQIVVGLGFQAQLQSLYLPDAATQGQRKIIGQATVRVEASRGLTIGTNQPDGSAQSPMQTAPRWTGLVAVPDLAAPAYGSAVVPLYTGDIKIQVPGAANKGGQVAVQQDNPLPMNVLAIIPEVLPGDDSDATPRQKRAA